MGRTLYRRKNIIESVRNDETRLTNLEIDTKDAAAVVPGTTTSDLSFQFQATSFTESLDNGDARVYPTTATSTIDEETNVSVAAYATFDDVGGNAAATNTNAFDANTYDVPLLDAKGKVAFYHGNPKYLAWDPTIHPTVVHTKQFMAGNSIELNVPGTATVEDTKSNIYYSGNAAFNNSVSMSVSLWFYPTDTSQISTETFRFLVYRYVSATVHYMACIKPSDQKVYVFNNNAGTITKLVSTGTVNINQWNLLTFTFNPTGNLLVIYLNNSSSSSTPADAPPIPYTTNDVVMLGGLYGLWSKRFTGYLDNFVFWTGKILTGTEASNMWNHGTII